VNFRRENFDRCQSGHGKESTAKPRSDNGAVAIFVASSTSTLDGPILRLRLFSRNIASAGAEGTCDAPIEIIAAFDAVPPQASSRLDSCHCGRQFALGWRIGRCDGQPLIKAAISPLAKVSDRSV
jgi:hypothetical protein